MVTLFNYLNSPTYSSIYITRKHFENSSSYFKCEVCKRARAWVFVCMCVSVCICGCVRGYVGVHVCVEEYGTLFSLSTPQGISG